MHPVEWTTQDLAGTGHTIDVWWQLLTNRIDPLPHEVASHRAAIDRLAAIVRDDEAAFDERATAGTDVLAELSAAGRAVHAAGLGAAHHRGAITSVNVSAGGVPKQPVERAAIGLRGLDTDRQAKRKHHGRVFQAVSLWSADVIAELQAEGHPVFAGACGENITISGIDWPSLRPGTRLLVGSALCEITVPAVPCSNNAQWFIDGNFNRMHYERHPGATRQYAMVIEPGSAAVGDEVVVEP
jgi:MOSC domain-containing protein YiiM